MEKEKKSEIHITNNFNAPIGQHIDHVDTINFRMDGDGTFHFGKVDNMNDTSGAEGETRREEEMFHFIHPGIDDDEGWKIHDAVKRLVAYQKVPEICKYLRDMKQMGKVLLPPSPTAMYNELRRLGLPTGKGFSEKNFTNYYMK